VTTKIAHAMREEEMKVLVRELQSTRRLACSYGLCSGGESDGYRCHCGGRAQVKSGKLVLVLDLDNTLIFAQSVESYRHPNFERPRLRHFLQCAAEEFSCADSSRRRNEVI
jgi:hypothetical protein